MFESQRNNPYKSSGRNLKVERMKTGRGLPQPDLKTRQPTDNIAAMERDAAERETNRRETRK